MSMNDVLKKLYILSDNGMAEWWTNSIVLIGKDFKWTDADIDIFLTGWETYDLVIAHIHRWLEKHPDCFVWCPVYEAYISLSHGKDIFADDIVEMMEHILEKEQEK